MGYSSEQMLCFGVDSSNKYFGTDITPGTKDTIIFDCGETDLNKGSLTINGHKVVDVDLQSFTNQSELKLFSLGDNNGCYFKFYEAKVYQDGVMVRHFIPAKNIYFRVDGIYDLVEGKFYQSNTKYARYFVFIVCTSSGPSILICPWKVKSQPQKVGLI